MEKINTEEIMKQWENAEKTIVMTNRQLCSLEYYLSFSKEYCEQKAEFWSNMKGKTHEGGILKDVEVTRHLEYWERSIKGIEELLKKIDEVYSSPGIKESKTPEPDGNAPAKSRRQPAVKGPKM